MKHEDEQALKVGREVIRTIRDVLIVAGVDSGYALRTFTFPGGEVAIFVVHGHRLSQAFERAAAAEFELCEAIPPSTAN